MRLDQPMRNHLHRLCHDERGMSFVYVAMGFMAFMAATTLAIDVGMFMTARTQAQNAADAGAMAGAVALAFNDYDDRGPSGPAVQSALNAAIANKVMREAVSVKTSDVTFPVGPTGLNNRVRVEVYRTTERENPVETMIASIFGVNDADIVADAIAEVSPASAVTCVKPFMIPDRWNEKQNGPWDPNDTFEMYDNHDNLLANPDEYIGDLNSPLYTGYKPNRDKGMELMLRAGTGNNIEPTMYFSWKMPGPIGADFYEENISGCNDSMIEPGHLAIQEPGNMMGPTTKGVERLIAQDPDARWDTGCNCVKDSDFAKSPRIFPIPLYDPAYYAEGKANGRNADFKIANFLGFFVTRLEGNNVYGRVTPITGVVKKGAPQQTNAFAKAIRLVE
jgi:Flp pilus assembly protein TadG